MKWLSLLRGFCPADPFLLSVYVRLFWPLDWSADNRTYCSFSRKFDAKFRQDHTEGLDA